jgi:hypothetical protein
MVDRRYWATRYPGLRVRVPYDAAREWDTPCRIGHRSRRLLVDVEAMHGFLTGFVPRLFTTTQLTQQRGHRQHEYLLQEVEIHLHDGGQFKRSDAQIARLVDDGGDPTPSKAAERVKKRRQAFLAGLKKSS